MNENVEHPKHYNAGQFEVIDVIEDWKLGFNLGNAVKYIGRAEHKGEKEEDLKKAIWYIEREIKRSEQDKWHQCFRRDGYRCREAIIDGVNTIFKMANNTYGYKGVCEKCRRWDRLQ